MRTKTWQSVVGWGCAAGIFLIVLAPLGQGIAFRLRAQEPAPAKPPAALTDATKTKLLEAQHEMDKLQLQAATLQSQIAQLQMQFNGKLGAFQKLQSDAFTEAGADPAAYTLDLDTMTFTPVPKRPEPPRPAPPAPARP